MELTLSVALISTPSLFVRSHSTTPRWPATHAYQSGVALFWRQIYVDQGKKKKNRWRYDMNESELDRRTVPLFEFSCSVVGFNCWSRARSPLSAASHNCCETEIMRGKTYRHTIVEWATMERARKRKKGRIEWGKERTAACGRRDVWRDRPPPSFLYSSMSVNRWKELWTTTLLIAKVYERWFHWVSQDSLARISDTKLFVSWVKRMPARLWTSTELAWLRWTEKGKCSMVHLLMRMNLVQSLNLYARIASTRTGWVGRFLPEALCWVWVKFPL